MNPPIPVICITGFLGSGKTSLINRWLGLSGLPKLGVLVNEFGKVGIDGALLGPKDVVEMSGGCVCCATGEELWETAKRLVETSAIACLVIETSGIANPHVLLEQFSDLPKELSSLFRMASVACLVDPLHFFRTLDYPETNWQLSAASCVLLSKQDVTDAQTTYLVHQELDRLHVTSSRSSFGKNSSNQQMRSLLQWLLTSSMNLTTKSVFSKTKHQPQLQSISIQTDYPVSKPLFLKLVEQLANKGDVVRAKGVLTFIDLNHLVTEVFHWVLGTVEFSPFVPELDKEENYRTGSQWVVIGQGLNEDEINALFQSCVVAKS